MSDNQQSFVTLGEPVGFVTILEGTVRVQSVDGQERVVRVGDPIFFGETVVAVGDGSVTISFIDGTEIIVADQSAVEINNEVFGLAESNNDDQNDFLADGTSDIEALQQAILAGDDPTQSQAAPAAGQEQQNDNTNEDTTVEVNRSNQEANPTYGYDTDARSADSQLRQVEQSDIDTVAVPGDVIVDDITFDDVINILESQSTITVTGTAIGGDISPGDPVVMTINDTEYSTTVNEDGTWAVDVLGTDLVVDTDFQVVVSSTDNVGNEVDSIGLSEHSVDLSVGSATIEAISEDTGQLSDDFYTSDNTLIVNGEVELEDEDVLTVTFNGTEYTLDNGLTISGNTWSIDVTDTELADGIYPAEAEVTDLAGNVRTVIQDVTIDTLATDAPTVSIIDDNDPDDGIIRSSELGEDGVQVSVSINDSTLKEGGFVTLNITNGDSNTTLDLSLENGELISDNGSVSGFSYSLGVISWSENVSNGDEISVTATQTDIAGNVSSQGLDNATVRTAEPEVSIIANANSVDEGDIAGFTVQLSEEFDQDVVVTLSLGGSADSSDYSAPSSLQVSLPAGSTSATINLSTLLDGQVEGTENLIVSIDSVDNEFVKISSLNSASSSIIDADSAAIPTVSVSADAASVDEGSTAGFEVSLSKAVEEDVVITFTISGDVNSEDYTAPTEFNVTIPKGATSTSIDLATLTDGEVEGTENLTVSLTGVSSEDVELSSQKVATTAIIDADTETLPTV
ncbi:MAG: retention module-containing protein [Marinomonas atlantica]|nr:retention module-containing protein [Marinomonas atlantica]